MNSKTTRVCIIYPADPAGSVPGGIDTFIRGEIDNVPDDIEYSVIGITTNATERPVGQWTTCQLKSASFRFYPVMRHRFTDRAPLIPVTVRYMFHMGSIAKRVAADVIEVHRVEPLIRLRRDKRPKTAVFHQNMQSLYDKNADIRWSSLPSLYFRLEDRTVPRLDSAFCVRRDAADYYRDRFPNLAESCWFQPTWADPQYFSPVPDAQRQGIRAKLADDLGLDTDAAWLISVGRLDKQKDPLLMIEAIQRLVARGQKQASLLFVGEGPLRDDLTGAIAAAGLSGNVRLLGLKGIDEIAELLHASDLFVMSSAYEGMPMAVIEALASGVPVATTRVGEVALVVKDGVCGRIAEPRTAENLCDAIDWCLQNLKAISGAPCVESASKFSPANVLQPVYENYRRLAAGS